MVWATHALQSGRPDQARPLLLFPKEAATRDLASKFAVHPWKLETLLNELLAVPKLQLLPNRPNRRLDCRKFAAIAKATNYLAGLENAEDGMTLKRVNVLRDIHRLAQRQFEWQRGFLSHSQFYRSGFIYGGQLTKAYFHEALGFTMDDFTLACFALHALFINRPIVQRNGGMDQIGINETTLSLIFDLISIRLEDARRMAVDLRAGSGHTAYKRSLFRIYPCVAFGTAGERVHSPLPALTIVRSTSGLFYDVIKGGDNVRNEVSARFEAYCLDLLRQMLPKRQVRGSYTYAYRKNRIDTPDILIYEGDAISVVLECKATRMSYEARFSEDPFSDARRGYEEIAKGVFQIWRFASHHRRGVLEQEQMLSSVRGVVLTLDTWLSTANAMQSDVMELARGIAAGREPDITAVDQIPIAFCPIDELEQTLSSASDDSFLRTVRAATEERFQGWQLSGVHRELAPDLNHQNEYPFANRLPEVLTWWPLFGERNGAGP
jgi:hypothetical protein